MPKQLINLGTTPNDRSGDTLRDAGSKMNQNTNEIYTALGNGTNLQVSVAGATTGQVLKFNGTTFVPQTDQNTDAVTSVNTKVGAVVLNTDDISEAGGATNQWFTNARARAAISTANGALGYNSTTGVLSFTQGNSDTVAEGSNNLYFTQGRFDFALSQRTTNNLTEGSTNLYFTQARARAAISATQNVTYNSTTGVITGPNLATVATSGSYNDLTDKPSLGATTQWTVDSSGTALNFTGNGFLGSEDNPTIYVYRGMRYQFTNESGGPLEFVDATSQGVRSVTISNGGLYATAPTVSFTGGTGSGAAGTAVLSTAGSINTVTVTNGGSGYSQAPTVTFTGGTGAVASATLTATGPVESITVTNGGSGYSSAPTIAFTASTGTGATATAILGFAVSNISIGNGGTGYTTAPTVLITGDGTGATATATVVGGVVTAISVTNGGSGYTTTPTVILSGGGGTGATAAAVLASTGSVKSITVDTAGSGYSSDVAATITGAATNIATVSVNRSLSIDTVTVSNGGSGYPSNTSVVFTPAAGDNIIQAATATATLQFPVASVTITNSGTYTVAPNVAFASGSAAATATIGLKLVPANQDFTAATAANNGTTILCPLMSTTTGTKWKYRLVGSESTQVGDIVVV